MANLSDLPTEIQLLVVRNLSEFELLELKSLNSLFFNKWMDAKWREVRVELRHPDSAVRLLQRMVDPFVATRLKTLSINLDQKEPPSRPELTISESQSLNGAVTILLDSLPLLVNITRLSIHIFKSFTFDVAAFFERIASLSFARKLSLTELSLSLSDNRVARKKLVSLSLEHFLRSLAPTLRHLYIWTVSDLCPLFNALPQPLSLSQSHPSVPFPNLTTLFLCLPFDTLSWRSDPQGLLRFLLTHSNLQHLYLRTHITTPETEESLAALLTELVNNNDQLPSLQTLDVYPSASQTGLSALLTLIKRFTPTLSSLVIPNRCLTDEEANQVVDALTEDGVRVPGMTTTLEESRKLKSLEMRISCLSVPFLDLLARKLPQLESLYLHVNNIIGSEQYSFYEQLSQRRYDPNIACSRDILHTWNLQDISIYWNWENRIQSGRAERAVMGAIPALDRRMELEDMEI